MIVININDCCTGVQIITAISGLAGTVLGFLGVYLTVKAREDIAKISFGQEQLAAVNDLVSYLNQTEVALWFNPNTKEGAEETSREWHFTIFQIGKLSTYKSGKFNLNGTKNVMEYAANTFNDRPIYFFLLSL